MIILNKEGGGQSGSCRRRFKTQGNRSQVQGSTFRVKNKEGIKDPKSSLNQLFEAILDLLGIKLESLFKSNNAKESMIFTSPVGIYSELSANSLYAPCHEHLSQ
jgi:hypothetical protein